MSDHGAAGLDAAVIAIDRLAGVVDRGRRIVQPQAHVLGQRWLVALQRQAVVAATVEDRLSGRLLAVHRIGGDDPALERQQRQQLGQGLDLVAGGTNLLLAQDQPLLHGPGAHQVQRPAPRWRSKLRVRRRRRRRPHRPRPLGRTPRRNGRSWPRRRRDRAAGRPARRCRGSGCRLPSAKGGAATGSLARPNRAMSTPPSAPHKLAASAISRISNRSWRWALPVRGSTRSLKHARNRSMPPSSRKARRQHMEHMPN